MTQKKKRVLLFGGIVLFLIIIAVIAFAAFSGGDDSDEDKDVVYTTTKATKNDMVKTLTAAGEITAAASETIDFSTSKTFSAMCVEENEAVTEGQHLVLYTNGTYESASADGIVTDICAPEAGTVADDTNSLTLNHTGQLSLEITVPEDQVNEIKKGDSALITVSADTDKQFNGRITGKKEMSTTLVSEKASEVAAATESSSSGLDSGQSSSSESSQPSSSMGSDPFGSESSTAYYTVSMKFSNDGTLLPGMSANCTVTLSERKNILTVPVEAVSFDENGKAYVEKGSEDSVEKTVVTIGDSDADNVEIKKGLQEGDSVRLPEQK